MNNRFTIQEDMEGNRVVIGVDEIAELSTRIIDPENKYMVTEIMYKCGKVRQLPFSADSFNEIELLLITECPA